MAFGNATRLFVRQGTQREACHHSHFLGSKVRLNPLEYFGQKAVTKRNGLFRPPVRSRLVRLPLKPLLFRRLLFAEMDFARPICAHLDESAFF
jgi:hypothetical protein